MKRILMLTLSLAAAIFVAPTFAASPATAAFHQLQGLAGNWDGTGDDGMKVKSNFQLIAGNTAVMETLAMSGMDSMVSLYSIRWKFHFSGSLLSDEQPAAPARDSAGWRGKTACLCFRRRGQSSGHNRWPRIQAGHGLSR